MPAGLVPQMREKMAEGMPAPKLGVNFLRVRREVHASGGGLDAGIFRTRRPTCLRTWPPRNQPETELAIERQDRRRAWAISNCGAPDSHLPRRELWTMPGALPLIPSPMTTSPQISNIAETNRFKSESISDPIQSCSFSEYERQRLLDLHPIETSVVDGRIVDGLDGAVTGDRTAEQGPTGVLQCVFVLHLIIKPGLSRE
jgi:hypothetical protein